MCSSFSGEVSLDFFDHRPAETWPILSFRKKRRTADGNQTFKMFRVQPAASYGHKRTQRPGHQIAGLRQREVESMNKFLKSINRMRKPGVDSIPRHIQKNNRAFGKQRGNRLSKMTVRTPAMQNHQRSSFRDGRVTEA